ncbi:MAG: 16S rRNA (cytidine(1402)-2'-O)-methyltransferase [Proteobacteria bacterium]|nr:16S rRNA (cytidine(1402)-2'-O)-methyltransferase [Pseudomonadota bacterium]MBW3617616.1 16S rRNA (cytidine(1402)-2'-O)-methyltransferase [Pseudomonadota bacterium]
MPAQRPNFELTEAKPLQPGLHIVSTPIGNLRDITLRALDTLAAADRVFAEDTRTAAKLLSAFGLKNRLEAYHDHNGEAARPRVMAALAAGEGVALVSEAGTPLISDPGFKLVREAAAAGHPVFAVPGPSAVLAALTVAGLPTDRFLFAGFLPPKSVARRRALEELTAVRATLVLFESGPRLPDLLRDMAEVLGAREAAVARELTKLYESCVRGPLPDLAADPRFETIKGEIVVLAAPGEPSAEPAAADAALREALGRLSPGEAAGEVARALNLPRRDLYRRALAMKVEE